MTAKRLSQRFVVLSFMSCLPTGMCAPILVLLLASKGLDVGTIGALLGIYGFTAALLDLPTGGLADVVGRRPVLLAASAMFLASTLMLGLGAGLVVIGAAVMLEAGGRALDSGPLEAWYVDARHITDPNADLIGAFARSATAQSAAIAIGALAGGALGAGWVRVPGFDDTLATPCVVAGGVIVVRAALLMAWVRDDAPPAHQRLAEVLKDVPPTISTGVRACIFNSNLRVITALCGVIGVLLATIQMLIPLRTAELFEDDSRAVLVVAGFAAVAGFARAAGSAMAPRLQAMTNSVSSTVVIAFLLAAASVVATGWPIAAVLALGYVVVNFALGVPDAVLDDLTHHATGAAERATVLSVQSLSLRLCGSVGVFAAGFACSHLSIEVAAAGASAAALIGAGIAAKLSRRAEHRSVGFPGETATLAR